MKYNVSSARSSSSVSLNHSHLTTLDFSQVLPIESTECIIGDKHNVNISPYVRLAPMVNPTYGSFDLCLTTLFVPFYQVFKDFDSFYSNVDSLGGEGTGIPKILMTLLTQSFLNNQLATEVPLPSRWPDVDEQDLGTYDFFKKGPENSSVTCYKFTSEGRYIYKLLNACGYTFIPDSDTSFRCNALPVLCFLKAFNDWFTISSNYSSSPITAFLRNPYVSTPSGSHDIDVTKLIECLRLCIPVLGDDYFTGLQQFVNLPSNSIVDSQHLDNGILDGKLNPQSPAWISTANPRRFDVGSSSSDLITNAEKGEIPAFSIDTARALQMYIVRNNLAGTRAAQRIYSRFGLKSEDFRSNYAHLIHRQKIPFVVGDVTSTSSYPTAGVQHTGLGTYAGQGIAQGNYRYSYECNDFGMLFTFANIEARAQYMPALSPTVVKQTALDFYQPEFDGTGFAPVCLATLHSNYKVPYSAATPVTPSPTTKFAFGFSPRYQEYRQTYDRVSGDFASTEYSSMKGWHFGRDFDFHTPLINNTTGVVVSPQSMQFQTNGREFDRIFQRDSVSDSITAPFYYDHFICQFNFGHVASRPILSPANSLGLPDGNITQQQFGTQVDN